MKIAKLITALLFLLVGLGCIRKHFGHINNQSRFIIDYYVGNNKTVSLSPKLRQKCILFFEIATHKEIPLECMIKIDNKELAILTYSISDFERIGWEIVIPEDIDTSKTYTQYPFE